MFAPRFPDRFDMKFFKEGEFFVLEFIERYDNPDKDMLERTGNKIKSWEHTGIFEGVTLEHLSDGFKITFKSKDRQRIINVITGEFFVLSSFGVLTLAEILLLATFASKKVF